MSDRTDDARKVLNLAESDLAEPEGRFACKFVLVRYDGDMHLVFGPVRLYSYHANLLKRFCDEFAIPSIWERHPDFCAVYDPRVEIRGGGFFDIDQAKKKVVASGRSTAYGPYEKSDLERVLRVSGVFEGYRVKIQAR